MKNLFAVVCVLALSAFAHAGEIAMAGKTATVKGIIRASDAAELDKSDLETIIFEESLGGTMDAVSAYVELIKRRKLNTVVKGRCFSACAVSFLAGSTRKVFPAVENMIMFHVARVVDKSTGALRPSNQNEKLLALIDELTERRMRDPVRSKIASSWSEASGVVFAVGPGWWGQRMNTFYCDGSQGRDITKCSPIFNANPYDFGILTGDAELSKYARPQHPRSGVLN
jgi:hypothetical protein